MPPPAPHIKDSQLQFLSSANASDTLRSIARGIEKEGLRVRAVDDTLSLEPHPQALGSPLTNSWVTTDFSEALLEFITPACRSIKDTLNYLTDIHAYTANNLNGEIIWNASMPCTLPADNDIPLAEYGSSNIATMKTVYRRGLGHRYGRAMQTVAGIHYNFSLPETYWALEASQRGQPLNQDYINRRYLDLIRNFRRHYWLLIYLLGCSPCADSSFVAGRSHKLDTLKTGDLYLPYATSLRMGDLGYQSVAQKSLFICYNELASYTKTLADAMHNPYPPYNIFGMKKDGVYQQLSTSLLQIENEFYSPIRPKRTTESGEKPLHALNNRGIEYIEVRCIDISPYAPVGISENTIHFLDAFLLTCLLLDSPPCNENEFAQINENQARVVDTGRKPGLKVYAHNREVTLSDQATHLLTQVLLSAQLFDGANNTNDYARSVESQSAKIQDPSQTPSGKLLDTARNENLKHVEIIHDISTKHMQLYKERSLEKARHNELKQQAIDSLDKQQEIEQADKLSFDEYLADYFSHD